MRRADFHAATDARLQHPDAAEKSDRELGRELSRSHTYIARRRRRLEARHAQQPEDVRQWEGAGPPAAPFGPPPRVAPGEIVTRPDTGLAPDAVLPETCHALPWPWHRSAVPSGGTGVMDPLGAARDIPDSPRPEATRPPRPPGLRVRVRRHREGFYGGMTRREGEVFDLRAAGDFSSRWMERVSDDTPLQATSAPQRLERAFQARHGHPPFPVPPAETPATYGLDFDPDSPE